MLALALAQKGINTIVFEQAPGPPKGLRGEILQPNGQQVLDRLGLLSQLPVESTRTVHKFHFCRVGGERLCTVDYRELPPPYNQAVVTLPNVAHHAILSAIEREPSVSLRYRSSLHGSASREWAGRRADGQAGRRPRDCEGEGGRWGRRSILKSSRGPADSG